MHPIVHLVFKTHLDIGFTDYAANVIQKYFRQSDDFTLLAGRFEIVFDPRSGAICHMVDQTSAFVWATETNPLALLVYEVFGQEDYDRFWNQYIRNPDSELVWGGRGKISPNRV